MTQENSTITKKKLEDIALKLFVQDGYEKTSINNIVKKAQVSKGAFYHYFESKEEILNSVLDHYGESIRKIIVEIAQNKDSTGLEKFNLAFLKIQEYKSENIDRLFKLGQMMENEQDNKFITKFIEKLLEYINKPFAEIIKQGIKEGDFETDYPEEVMGSIMYLGIYMMESTKGFLFNPKKALLNIKTLMRKYNFIMDAITRILGAEKGAVKIGGKSLKDVYKIVDKKLSNQ